MLRGRRDVTFVPYPSLLGGEGFRTLEEESMLELEVVG